MGLQITTTVRGMTINNAYVRVTRFAGNRTSLSVDIGYAVSREADEYFHAETFGVPYDLAGSDPCKQTYEFLKKLPEFAGAVDVLEDGQTA